LADRVLVSSLPAWSSGGGTAVGLVGGAGAALDLFEPVTVTVHLKDVNVVSEAIEPVTLVRLPFVS
jgi:hypothetical protein